MTLRNLISSILAVATVSLSPFASADPLKIFNFTDYPSTTKANDGPCSSILKDGVTPAHTPPDQPHIVSERSIKVACMAKPDDCHAVVFLTNNCSGPKIAEVIFDIKNNTGVKKITNEPDSNYCIVGKDFTVTLDNKDSDTCRNQS